jgi:chaperone required for assembly of F1-ATPase
MKNGNGPEAPKEPPKEAPKQAPKRFYQTVSIASTDEGWQVLLDGRGVKTPKRMALLLPAKALADAIAAEWDAQTGSIDPRTMPMTRLANTTLDGVIGREEAVAQEIVSYAAHDLLCYRAENPEDLARLQQERWDPLLAWAREHFGAALTPTSGIMHISQPDDAVARLRDAVMTLDAFALAAAHVMTTLTGSAVLALAHIHGRLGLEDAWNAAHLDEDYQIGRWGEDAEAQARRALRLAEMTAASWFFHASRV